MVFKQLEKGLRGLAIKAKEVSISRTVISFGVEIGKDMLEKGAAEIWLDTELNKVGFKPTEDTFKGFTTKTQCKSGGTRITCKVACGRIPKGIYEAKEEDGMWVIQVPEIARK